MAVYERTALALGKPAPTISGKDKSGRPLSLRRFKGKTIVLVIGAVDRDRELKTVAVVGIGNDHPGWPRDEKLMKRFNALDRPRLFVLDKAGIIRAKDPTKKQLAELLAALK